MKKYKIIGETNGYIASHDIHFNGKTKVEFAHDLSLEDAISELDSFFYKDYGYYHDSFEIDYNEENDEPIYAIDDRWTNRQDGTACYEYDSRYYSIVDEDNL